MTNLYVGYIKVEVIANNKQEAMRQVRDRIAEVPNQFMHRVGYAPTLLVRAVQSVYGDNTTVLRDMVKKTK